MSTDPSADPADPKLEAAFAKLKEKVLEKRPVLREILSNRGTRKIFDYAKLYIDVNAQPPIKKRQDEFLAVFRAEVEARFDAEVAESAVRQLESYYFVSTVDHHSPICSHYWINGNLVTAAPHFVKKDPVLKYVIVFACANVSLNNISFPRGITFHTYHDGKVEEQKLSFFPAGDRLCPVYNFRSYTTEDVARMKKTLAGLVREGKVHPEEEMKVNALVDEIYLDPKILAAATYSDQVSQSNFLLWRKMFASSEVIPPDLVYLEIESLVNRLLLKNHLEENIVEKTSIHDFLFNPDYEPLIYKYFEGIGGCFSRQENWGTYLFWCLPPGKKYRMQMWKEANFLVSEDKSYRVELTPKAVREGILKGELIPGSMLCYVLLAFYYGLKCLGGFSQVNYLTMMKNAYMQMERELGNSESVEVCECSETKEMGGDYTIAFSRGGGGEMVPSTGVDLILYGEKSTWQSIVEAAQDTTLEEGINPLMPGFYRVLYPESARDPELMAVTPEDVTRITGLDKKNRACVQLKKH